MGIPKAFLRLAAIAGAVVLAPTILYRASRQNAVERALNRIRSTGNPGTIITRNQLLFLARLHDLTRELRDVETLMNAPYRSARDIHSEVTRIDNMLKPYRGRSEMQGYDEAGNGQAEDQMWNRILDIFPRQNRPAFFIAGPPDLASVLGGIDRDPPGQTDPQTEEHRYPDGTRDTETTSRGEDGTTKIVHQDYDKSGRLAATIVTLVRPSGTRETTFDIYGDRFAHRTVTVTDPDGRLLSHEHYWREGNDNFFRPGNPYSGVDRYPTDESLAGDRSYFLRLRSGDYARCVVLNPSSGFGHCTVLGKDLVNIRSGSEPMFDGTYLIINPYDLVVNPNPDVSVVTTEPSPDEIARRFQSPDPGGHPGPGQDASIPWGDT